MKRTQQAQAAHALKAAGEGVAAIARELGVSAATARRLLSGPVGEAGTDYSACGRPRGVALTEADVTALRACRWGRGGSLNLGAEDVLRHPAASAELKTFIRAELDAARTGRRAARWPRWMLREARITADARESLKGPKAGQNVRAVRPRGAFYIEVIDGEPVEKRLFANAVWESDDESENNIAKWTDPATGREMLARQSLKTIDVYSNKILGSSHLGTVRDGYTADDQADHARELVTELGMPLVWRLEQGPWKNALWDGIAVPKKLWHTPYCASERWGGVGSHAGGPIKIDRAWTSGGKGQVEGTFNFYQTLRERTGQDIGRKRGSNEAAEKLVRAARRGNLEALDAFQSLGQRADIALELARDFNGRLKNRDALGGFFSPDELYAGAVSRPCPESDLWRFTSCKGAAHVRNKLIRHRARQHYGRDFLFDMAALEPAWEGPAYLPHGWPVFFAFNPRLVAEEGCFVFNALHRDDPRNLARAPRGLFLGTAPEVSRAPQFVIGLGADMDVESRQRAGRAVRTETRILKAAHKAGHVAVSAGSDGLGNQMAVRRLENAETLKTETLKSSELPKPELHRNRRTAVDQAELEALEAEIF